MLYTKGTLVGTDWYANHGDPPLSWSIPTDDIDESFEKGDVMFAVDDGDDSGDDRTTVIADVSNDEAYLAMPYDESHTLSQWR